MAKFRSRLGRWFTIPELQRAYQTTLRSPAGEHWVLPDLAEFCRAFEPAPREDSLWIQGRVAGRRDVFLHIAEILGLTQEELEAIYRQRSFLQPQGPNG